MAGGLQLRLRRGLWRSVETRGLLRRNDMMTPCELSHAHLQRGRLGDVVNRCARLRDRRRLRGGRPV